jgi:hypothetical protein
METEEQNLPDELATAPFHRVELSAGGAHRRHLCAGCQTHTTVYFRIRVVSENTEGFLCK